MDVSDAGESLPDPDVFKYLQQFFPQMVSYVGIEEEAGDRQEAAAEYLLKRSVEDMVASTIACSHGAIQTLTSLAHAYLQNKDFRIVGLILGTIANLLSHSEVSERLSQEDGVITAVLTCILAEGNSFCIAEALRAVDTALRRPGSGLWMAVLGETPELPGRLLLFLQNICDVTLLERWVSAHS